MAIENYTIAYIFKNTAGDYFTGDGWEKGREKLCLYTKIQAAEKWRDVIRSTPDAFMCCVIQDKAFNFYDSHEFISALNDAKLYNPEDAEMQLRRLNLLR